MDVLESPLGKILEGSNQYEIPLYQRPYSWQSKNWAKLWDDIFELAESRQKSPGASHFTGTLVLEASSITTGLTKFLVVDGQQRLTTLSVLIAAIADKWEGLKEANAAKRVREQYLINVYADSTDKFYRLRPANFDEPVYRNVVDGKSTTSGESQIHDAFSYFKQKINSLDNSTVSLKDLEDAVLTGLKFVTITAKADDNVYRIFESINNTGIDLTQADLVRNLIFMRLENRGESVYETLWLPLVKDLLAQDVETVFWIDALWRDPDTRKLDVYEKQKHYISTLDTAQLVSYLENVLNIAEALRRIRKPSSISQPELERRVHRFAALKIPGALPVATRILYLNIIGQATDIEAADAFRVLESYLVRRAIVAAPVGSLGRITARCAFELTDDLPNELHKRLSTGKLRYVTDSEIRRTIAESSMYERGRRDHLKLILQWILETYQGKDSIDFGPMTIEHILPQTLSGAVREEFSTMLSVDEDIDQVFESLVHTLGNLTLTNYNSELSNSPFTVKRTQGLKNTSVIGNHLIAANEDWGPSQIAQRAGELTEIAVNLWQGPDETLLAGETTSVIEQIANVIALVEPGRWTTYGDIAKVVGTASQVVGMAASRAPIPDGAWRVLRAGGVIAEEFRWPEGSPHNGQSCQEVLEIEGISFDGQKANSAQRLRPRALAERMGIFEDESDTSGGEE